MFVAWIGISWLQTMAKTPDSSSLSDFVEAEMALKLEQELFFNKSNYRVITFLVSATVLQLRETCKGTKNSLISRLRTCSARSGIKWALPDDLYLLNEKQPSTETLTSPWSCNFYQMMCNDITRGHKTHPFDWSLNLVMPWASLRKCRGSKSSICIEINRYSG